ncbi:MAG: hypothetical protein SWH61_01865 [Thermodesulfobacteriota bacterium]|nr:hypothetical protein [Thermodesulfobacteriota bacterium]
MADQLNDDRFRPVGQSADNALRERLRKINPAVYYEQYLGDPAWKILSEVAPVEVGKRIELIDKINQGLIYDCRMDEEFKALAKDLQGPGLMGQVCSPRVRG